MDILLFYLLPAVTMGIVTLYVWSRDTRTSSANAQTGDNGAGGGDEMRSVCNLCNASTVIFSFKKGGTNTVKMTENTCTRAGSDLNIAVGMGIGLSAAEWRDQLRCFLSPLRFGVRHRDISDCLTPGTGRWFLQSREFQGWVEGGGDSNQVLCCVGDPGVGKTGLACLAFESLQELQSTDNSALAFIYCDHMMQGEQTPTHLIGSLLAQLTNRLPDNNPIITELLVRQREGKALDLTSTLGYIERIAVSSSLASIRLGADGLDELRIGKEHRSRFLDALAALSRTPNIQFLLFTRNHSGVRSDVDVCFQEIRTVTYWEITGASTVSDRRLFLEDRLDSDEVGSLFDEDLRTLILEKLAPKDSTFLLAVLHVYDVLNQETPAKAEATAAQSTKNDLPLTYERMLSRISPQGIKLLHWVLFATRLLTVEELRFAIAIEEGMVDLNPRSQLPFPSFLDSALGLLAVDSVEKTVRFAHLTVKDYLAEHSSRYFPTGHALLATTCLTFFNFTALSNKSGFVRFQCGGDLNAFFNYPAFNWGNHVRESEGNVRTSEMALEFLFSDQFQHLCGLRRINSLSSWAGCESPLHEACFFGLPSATVKLLKLGMNVNVLDSLHRTPLHYATHYSHLAVVKALLRCSDIDVNMQDKSGITPLHDAISDSQTDIVQALLQHPSIQLNSQDEKWIDSISFRCPR